MADEPAPDDDARTAAAGPAVHVDDPSRIQLGIDLVEDGDELFTARDREVAYGPVDVPGGLLDERCVGLEFAALREIEEERHARLHQLPDLEPCALGAPGARMTTCNEPSFLDDRRRSHDAEVCLRRYPVRGERLKRGHAGADSRDMARPDVSSTELRDRALTLASELGVDQGTWYVRVLDEGRREGLEPDLGALVRAYWELQRVTGRADLRDVWRSLADQLWSGEAA
jgi:hypothetical protein